MNRSFGAALSAKLKFAGLSVDASEVARPGEQQSSPMFGLEIAPEEIDWIYPERRRRAGFRRVLNKRDHRFVK